MRSPFLLGLFVGGVAVFGGYRMLVDPPDADARVAVTLTSPEPVQREAVEGFVGSDTCAECHQDLYEQWKPSGHSISIAPFSDERAARPFDGEYFVARDIEHKLGPGGQITCEGPGGEMQTFQIDSIIGVRRIQMFTTKMDGGRIQVLPVMLEVPNRRWFDYTHFIFGGPTDFDVPPDSPNSWYTFARNFNSRCIRCHATEFDPGYDPDAGTYETTWNEMAVGCESCHGAGGAHVTKWRRLEDGPDPIVNPKRLGIERGNMVCGQCHSESAMVQPGYKPGDDLWAFMDPAGLEDKKHVHPDGRARELIHNLVPILESECGPIACTKCHDPHGSKHLGDLLRPLSDDRTCTQCHEEIGANLTAHTHHKAESTGSRCVNCHMQRMVIEGGHGWTHDHTISVPSMVNTKTLGLTNACKACHVLEDTNWEIPHFERWYPDADKNNHRVPLAKAVAGGRKRTAEAKPLLEALAEDAKPIYRAGAVRLLAGYDTDLAKALEDPSPLVRRAAIDGVKRTDPAALVPLLDDPNHVLRYRAAMALTERHAREHPDVRTRVIEVLTEFARRKPDSDATHYALGILFEVAGDMPRARRSYARYLRINPWDQRIQSHIAKLPE